MTSAHQILRSAAAYLPRPLKRHVGYVWDYLNRINRWAKLLGCIRGHRAQDKLWLLISAVCAPVTSLQKLSEWQNPKILRDLMVEVSGIGVFEIRKNSDDIFHVLPFGEKDVFEKINSLLSAGDCFIDAGANIGFYSILAAQLVGQAGRVVAVEMMPDTAAILKRHVEYNKVGHIVQVVEQALSDEPDRLITARFTPGLFGQSSIAEGINPGGVEVTVKTTTLDRICTQTNKIRLMKMDLEGAEYLALQGASHVLKNVQNIIYENVFDQKLSSFLTQKGFSVQKMSGKECYARSITDLSAL